jgi:hypothetical protein
MPAHLLIPACFAAAVALVAQTPPPTGTVEGIVTNSVTGAPVRKALVTLREVNHYAGHQALSDGAGRFRIDNVAPAAYVIWAEAQGFVRDAPDYDRVAPRSRALTVADKTVKDVAVSVVPASVLTGRVLNQNGDPVPGATIQLFRYRYGPAAARMERTLSTTADDRGHYRLPDVAPGRWYLGFYRYVVPPHAEGRVHSSVADRGYGYRFHPGVERASEAAPVDVGPGAELTLDLHLNRVPVFHIRGRVVGAYPANAYVQADMCAGGNPPFHSASLRLNGVFDLWGLTPGPYCVWGEFKTDDKMSRANLQVTLIDRDINDAVLTLEPANTLAGIASMENGKPIADRVRITAQRLDAAGDPSSALIQPGGKFAIANLVAAPYRLGLDRAPNGLYFKSIRQGSEDVTRDARLDLKAGAPPVEIVLDLGTGRVNGTISGTGSGLAATAVTLAPADSARPDLVRTVDPQPTGAFQIDAVPPGRYLLFAWELADTALAESPEFRAQLASRATTVEVRAGEQQSAQPALITAAEVADATRRLR